MASATNGEDLIKMMDQADYFGEDRDEDLLSALARITYHLRRDKGEGHRSFFGKWDVAMRKVVEHRVDLPTKFDDQCPGPQRDGHQEPAQLHSRQHRASGYPGVGPQARDKASSVPGWY